MQHAVLATPEMPESHTGVNIKERIEQCLHDFGIEKSVVAYVADNGSNVVAALDKMPAPRLGCFAHTLQLGIKCGLKVHRVSAMRGAAKHLVKRFKKSSKAATALKTIQTTDGLKAYQLIMEVETRWNSTYCTFQRLLSLERTVKRDLSNDKTILSADARHLDMTESNWSLMKLLVPLLQPLKMITDLQQASNYPTNALIYPSLAVIKQHLVGSEQDNTIIFHSNRQSSQNWKLPITRTGLR